MAFLHELAQELGERRRRLRARLGDRGSSLFEFVILSGFALGLATGLANPSLWWLGLLPPAALVAGYAALDARRQAALRAGADALAVRRRFDMLALALLLAISLSGALAFAQGLRRPEPARIEVPDEAPSDAPLVDLD